MSPFLLRASSASGSVVLTRVELVGSFFAASLGSMAAGTRSAPRSVRGGGSTRKPGVVAAGAPGFDWQAGISTVGRVVGDSTTTGATSAADGPVGKAVKAAFAEGVALGRVSRGGFSSAGMAAAGTGAGINEGMVNDNYSFPWRQLLFASGPGVICSSHVGVWSGVCPLGGTESSAPAGADDGGEPKGQTVAFLFPGSRCLAFCARTLSPLNSKIRA